MQRKLIILKKAILDKKLFCQYGQVLLKWRSQEPKSSHARQNAFVAVPATGHNRAMDTSFFLSSLFFPPSRLASNNFHESLPGWLRDYIRSVRNVLRPDEFRNSVTGPILPRKAWWLPIIAHHRPSSQETKNAWYVNTKRCEKQF